MKLSAIFLLIFFTGIMTGFSQPDKNSAITVDELKNKINNNEDVVILDVRMENELSGPLGQIDNVINIPVQELEERIDELNLYKNKEIEVICRSGNRSHYATIFLNNNGFKARNVLGGMIEYRRSE